MKKILKFYSKTCGPCKVMGKNLEGLENIEIQNIDIADEDSLPLLEKWKIRTVPTIIVLSEDNNFIAEFKGIVPVKKIKEVLDKSC